MMPRIWLGSLVSRRFRLPSGLPGLWLAAEVLEDRTLLSPTVISISEVAPDPRTTPVASIDVTFSEPIAAGSFDTGDLALTRNGGANLIDPGVAITPLSPTMFRIGGLVSTGSEPALSAPLDDRFQITTFATGLNFPKGMALLPDGSLLVATTTSSTGSFFGAGNTGTLLRLVDADRDGRSDGPPQTLYSGLPGSLSAMRLFSNLVVVSNGSQLSFLRLGAAPADPLSLVGTITLAYPTGSQHNTSGLAVRPMAGLPNAYELYFNVGSQTNNGSSPSIAISGLVSGTVERDSIYRVTVSDRGSGATIVSDLTWIAKGLRNAAGITFDPNTGDLFFEDNGIDGLSNPNEPFSADELNRIVAADIGGTVEDFGFPNVYIPYRTGGQGFPGDNPLVAFQPLPDPLTGSESEGPAEIAFTPAAFQPILGNGVFVGFHGKFNTAGVANEENPLVYYDFAADAYTHVIDNSQAMVGHLNGLLATSTALFLADFSSTGSTSNGTSGGIIYRIGLRSGLGALTGNEGTYVLSVNAAGVTDLLGNPGIGSASESWTLDAGGPTVSVSPVSPNPRNTAVSAIDFTFSEPIDAGTLRIDDLTLTRSGGTNLLTSSQTIVSVSGTTYRVENFAGLTGTDGTYVLTVNAAGVSDSLGNAGSGSASAIWTKDAVGPTVSSFVAITPVLRNTPVDMVDVTFSEAIDPATFGWQDLVLMRNSGANPITSAQTVTWLSGTTWRIGGLASATSADGSYALKVNATGVRDLAGNAGTGAKSLSWSMDTLPPISQVSPLPAVATSPSFAVSVTGTDPTSAGGGAPSGVTKYDVFVSTNGSAFVLWKSLKANLPSAVFVAQGNTDYAFRSVGYDKAGNVEFKGAGVIEASIHVPDLSPPTSSVAQVKTNTPTFTINMQGKEVGGSTLVWIDLYVSVDGGVAQQIAHIAAGPPNATGQVTATAQYESLVGTHSYRFYTIATDSAGNVEAAPASGDKMVNYTRAAPTAISTPFAFGLLEQPSTAALDTVFSQPGDVKAGLWP